MCCETGSGFPSAWIRLLPGRAGETVEAVGGLARAVISPPSPCGLALPYPPNTAPCSSRQPTLQLECPGPLPYLGAAPVSRSRVRVIPEFATWIAGRQRAEAAPVEPAVTGQQPFALDERVRTDDEIRCDPLP